MTTKGKIKINTGTATSPVWEEIDLVGASLGDLTTLLTTNKSTVVAALNELFQNVSNGGTFTIIGNQDVNAVLTSGKYIGANGANKPGTDVNTYILEVTEPTDGSNSWWHQRLYYVAQDGSQRGEWVRARNKTLPSFGSWVRTDYQSPAMSYFNYVAATVGTGFVASIPAYSLYGSYVDGWSVTFRAPSVPAAATFAINSLAAKAIVYPNNSAVTPSQAFSVGGIYTVTYSSALDTFVLTSIDSRIPGFGSSIGTLSNLSTTAKSNIVSAVNELFQSASNGKALLAAAITGKGITTAATDSFATMANNINVLDKASMAGLSWDAIQGSTTNRWESVCYGNGLFVAVGSNGGTNNVMTSPDGVTWTVRTTSNTSQWYSLCYGNSLFVAIGRTGTNRVMTSPDGITWTARATPNANSWTSVCFGNGTFVAVAISGTGNRVMSSTNGTTWTARTSAADINWVSVCYGNGLFVAVANNGSSASVMTSPDGITWTTRTCPTSNGWSSVVYGDKFVAVDLSGSAMTSTDGINWTSSSTGVSGATFVGLAYGAGLYIAISDSTKSMVSTDGVTWTGGTLPSTAYNFVRLCFGNGAFVAVANLGPGPYVLKTPRADGATNNIRSGISAVAAAIAARGVAASDGDSLEALAAKIALIP